jgi:hypothetical protein
MLIFRIQIYNGNETIGKQPIARKANLEFDKETLNI